MTDPNYAELAQRFNVNQPKTDHMMTVAQLRDALAKFPDDAFVILRKDAEGNGFSPLAKGAVDPAWYVPDSTWSGETYAVGPDADGDVFEPQSGDLFAVELGPVN